MATLAVCHACRVLPPAVRMLDLGVKSMHQSQVTGVRNLPCRVDDADTPFLCRHMIPTAAGLDALQVLLTINELGIADAMDLRIAINAQDLAAKVNVTSPELLFRLMRSAATALRPGTPACESGLVGAGCMSC